MMTILINVVVNPVFIKLRLLSVVNSEKCIINLVVFTLEQGKIDNYKALRRWFFGRIWDAVHSTGDDTGGSELAMSGDHMNWIIDVEFIVNVCVFTGVPFLLKMEENVGSVLPGEFSIYSTSHSSSLIPTKSIEKSAGEQKHAFVY